MNFDVTLAAFVTGCQKIVDDHQERNFPTLPRTVIKVDGGQKFVRVVSVDRGQGRSAHCFVAREDGFNKKLGSWQVGDVFKPDGWKSPAKGRRGNIFNDDNGLGRMGPYGPEYNR